MLTDVCASRHVLIVLFLDRDECDFLSQSVRVEKKKKLGAFVRVAGGCFDLLCENTK